MQELSQKSIQEKEDESVYVIREALATAQRPALLWSLGKDSTAMLHMVRKAYLGKVPLPVVHLDTGAKFQEMYTFRETWTKKWGLDLVVAKNQEALSRGVVCCMDRRMSCCHRLKTQALQNVVAERGFDVLLVGIRRDEHGVRSKERYFSPRNDQHEWNAARQPLELFGVNASCVNEDTRKQTGLTPIKTNRGTHFRVHPLLHWAEIDIWSYTRNEGLPLVPLYFSRSGYRYRSLGCEPATAPVPSNARNVDEIIQELQASTVGERSGRAQDKESPYRMEQLRSLGYL